MPSAMDSRMMQQEVAPASRTPLERSPRRLERPNFATISLVESLPALAASFIFLSASAKVSPFSAEAVRLSTEGERVSTRDVYKRQDSD